LVLDLLFLLIKNKKRLNVDFYALILILRVLLKLFLKDGIKK